MGKCPPYRDPHHEQRCSASDKLLGEAPMWLSVLILLLIGLVVGFLLGFLAALYRQRRMRRHTGPEAANDTEEQQPALRGWLPSVLRYKRHVTAVTSGTTSADAPLRNGLQDSAATGQHTQEELVALSPSSAHASSPGPEEALPAPRQSQYVQDVDEEHLPIEAILGKQASLVRESSAIKAYPGEPSLDAPGPSTLVTAGEENESAKAARKAESARAVGDSYDMDELDSEWKELLIQLDAALLGMKKDAMDSQERAIAIRTLLVSTGREGPEAALSHAIEDVERYRRKKRRDIALHKQIDTLK